MTSQNKLEENLFILQDHFSKHLMNHRSYMIEMEKHRFVNTMKNQETQKLDDFADVQKKRRNDLSEDISKISEKCR